MKTVIIESPFAANNWPRGFRWLGRWLHARYLRQCIVDSLRRGEAPFASHAIYPQVLRDHVAPERAAGMRAGLAWMQRADFTAVYIDRGISIGMKYGINHARTHGKPVVYRTLRDKVWRTSIQRTCCHGDAEGYCSSCEKV